VELPMAWVESRCGLAGLRRIGATVARVDSEDRANGNVAANVLDGDPATFWHTRWQPRSDPPPHELVIDLGREMRLLGLSYLPRQDQSNGRVGRAVVFASTATDDWGEPVATLQGRDDTQLEKVLFEKPKDARFLRLQVLSEVNEQPFAAIAELDVLLSESKR